MNTRRIGYLFTNIFKNTDFKIIIFSKLLINGHIFEILFEYTTQEKENIRGAPLQKGGGGRRGEEANFMLNMSTQILVPLCMLVYVFLRFS